MTQSTVDHNDAELLLSLRASIRACTDCILRTTAREPVPWRGNVGADILVIGEAPGPEENKTGKPFIGSAGIKLQTLLRESGLWSVASFAFANSCQCFPDRGLHPTADIEYIDTCRKWMRAQVMAIKPQFILSVGAVAYRSIWGHLAIWPTLAQIHGKPMYWDGAPPNARPTCVWPTYHPSAALRSPKYKRIMLEDLRAMRSWVDRGERWPEDCMIGTCTKEFATYDMHGRGIGLCSMHALRQGSLFDA